MRYYPLTFCNYWRNSTIWVYKLGEVKHFSNLEKKSNEISLVVASECDIRQKNKDFVLNKP